MIKQDGLSWWSLFFTNASVSVDTFLVISGLLVTYIMMKELDRSKGEINVLLVYLHRYLRYGTIANYKNHLLFIFNLV